MTMMKKATLGVLAHVDAGKTTTIETMLWRAGEIRKPGRVDFQNTVMDYDPEEKAHGITIYAKETHLTWKDLHLNIIDTPGHVDFSSEMERVLSVLDAALVVINGQKGPESHTTEIRDDLNAAAIPLVLFVNKMDISALSRSDLMKRLIDCFGSACVDFGSADRDEHLAMASDDLLEAYMADGTIHPDLLRSAFARRQVIPVLFGSALKDDGVDRVLDLLDELLDPVTYPADFGARIYKISTADDGTRLTHVKITGGTLAARQNVGGDEKVKEIRIYSGKSYVQVPEVSAGDLAVLTGLASFQAGEGLGFEEGGITSLSSASMVYEMEAEPGANVLALADACRLLNEEDPDLSIDVDEQTHRITVEIRGAMQMEVLQKKIYERTGITVHFVNGTILYEETIAATTYGIGHFEPLRHYGEVQVRIDPLERGRGIVVESLVSADTFAAGWQNAVLSYYRHRRLRGVLTGALLTDVKISLLAGKASLKHTKGGDLRQAASRALRQGLMKADNVLLEPYLKFSLRLPNDVLSHALYDLDQRKAEVQVEEDGGMMKISGRGPARTLLNYQQEVTAYSHGRGIFQAVGDGYDVCQDADAIVKQKAYDPQADLPRTPDSVFCANGAGYNVPWNEVEDLVTPVWALRRETAAVYAQQKVDEAEVKRVFEMTSGRNRNPDKNVKPRKKTEPAVKKKPVIEPDLEPCMIVDGYNFIFYDPELKRLSKEDLYLAREKAVEELSAYREFTGGRLIIVFDGYRVENNAGTVQRKGSVEVVYTRTDETADAWIEANAVRLAKQYRLTVATSDALIQNSIFAHGAMRLSTRELLSRIDATKHTV